MKKNLEKWITGITFAKNKYKTMENTFTMEGLWAFIQSLSLSENNKEWLISRLSEPNQTKSTEEQIYSTDRNDPDFAPLTKERFIANVREGKREIDEGKGIPFDVFEKQLLNSIVNS